MNVERVIFTAGVCALWALAGTLVVFGFSGGRAQVQLIAVLATGGAIGEVIRQLLLSRAR